MSVLMNGLDVVFKVGGSVALELRIRSH